MKYKNAIDLFPQDLITEIQKYLTGGLVYIPQVENQRKPWGVNSGIKTEISRRNYEIRQKFLEGLAILELAEEYCLAVETIKKIVYTNKE